MDRPQLRPVPSRPPGPVDPVEAARHVRDTLPGLDEPACRALALSALVGRSREEIGGEVELAGDEPAEALARGRKALRRSLFPLAGSGWCERAERLISDRLDGELAPPGPARLEVHLNNCSRCVEHERRLAQAIDSLVAGFVERHSVPVPEPEPQPEPDEPTPLRIVEPPSEEKKAPVPVELTPRGLAAGALAWHALFALALLLAVAAVVIGVVGVLGGHF
jgi:hypothetical protein